MMTMKIKFATNQVDSYRVQTSVYNGPLDLLLQLIETAELDITSLSLAQVTDQYLVHIRNLPDMKPDEVSAFMVIAVKLLQIKSEVLLPRPPRREEDEEDPGDELARQLLAYKRYKEIADILSERKDSGYQSYLRLSPPLELKSKIDLGDFGIEELWKMAQEALDKNNDQKSINTVVTRPKITLQEKISEISRRFRSSKRLKFSQVLDEAYTKVEIVITFLAVLELIRGNYLFFKQDEIFGEIYLEGVPEGNEVRIGIENGKIDYFS